MNATAEKQRPIDGQKAVGSIIRQLRTLNSEMQLQQADILMIIAQQPGITVSDLQRKADLSQSAISRNVLALSQWKAPGVAGFNLVETVRDPREPRRNICFLTTTGKAFMTKLVRSIDPDFSIDKDTDARVAVDQFHEQAAKDAAAQRELDKKTVKAKR
jgi:DNA-binding MarR family transcriptional regulator